MQRTLKSTLYGGLFAGAAVGLLGSTEAQAACNRPGVLNLYQGDVNVTSVEIDDGWYCRFIFRVPTTGSLERSFIKVPAKNGELIQENRFSFKYTPTATGSDSFTLEFCQHINGTEQCSDDIYNTHTTGPVKSPNHPVSAKPSSPPRNPLKLGQLTNSQ